MDNPNINGTNVTTCRLMNPNDRNIYGNIHGGTILKMIEEAGMIVCQRLCIQQQKNKEVSYPVLACVERTDFVLPMKVNEVAHLHAKVLYTSEHSIEVNVLVYAECMLTGTKRLTNKSTLWYVQVSSKGKLVSVPQWPLSESEMVKGRARYEEQKANRNIKLPHVFDDWATNVNNPIQGGEAYTVGYSMQTLTEHVQPQACVTHENKLPGGYVMKIMDEAAGICAWKHCNPEGSETTTSCVTASMDTTNFYAPIHKGSIMNVRSRMIFTSNKSLIVQVVVLCESNRTEDKKKEHKCSTSAFFTYVSLGENGKPMKVPQLKLLSEAQKERFLEGEKMYNKQKLARQQQSCTSAVNGNN